MSCLYNSLRRNGSGIVTLRLAFIFVAFSGWFLLGLLSRALLLNWNFMKLKSTWWVTFFAFSSLHIKFARDYSFILFNITFLNSNWFIGLSFHWTFSHVFISKILLIEIFNCNQSFWLMREIICVFFFWGFMYVWYFFQSKLLLMLIFQLSCFIVDASELILFLFRKSSLIYFLWISWATFFIHFFYLIYVRVVVPLSFFYHVILLHIIVHESQL